jgi:hypothetical protein
LSRFEQNAGLSLKISYGANDGIGGYIASKFEHNLERLPNFSLQFRERGKVFANCLMCLRGLRHEQPLGHPLLEMLQYRRLVSLYRDRERLASGCPKRDNKRCRRPSDLGS